MAPGQAQAHSVGQEGRGCGAGPVELPRDRLAMVCAIPPRAVKCFLPLLPSVPHLYLHFCNEPMHALKMRGIVLIESLELMC